MHHFIFMFSQNVKHIPMMVPRRFHVVYRKTLSGYEHALNNTHVFQQELFSSNFSVFIKEMVSVYS